MTKRTAGKYERAARDAYATPPAPICKLLPHLAGVETFAEPMCGDGAIVRVLESRGRECRWASDIRPEGAMKARPARTMDVGEIATAHLARCDAVISNPPWPLPATMRKRTGTAAGDPTISIIRHLMQIKPTWLILAADFMHNCYFEPLAEHCPKIVSVGRVKWMAGTKHAGFDNAAWYLFNAIHSGEGPTFYPNRGPSNASTPASKESCEA